MAMAGDIDFFLRVLEHGDLAVLDRVGCEITIHSRQESALLDGDTRSLSELIEIAARHSVLTERLGGQQQIREQFAAYAAGMAYRHWRKRQTKASRAYWDLARRQGVGALPIALAVARLLCMRLLLRWIGVPLTPVQPQPFAASTEGVDVGDRRAA
jgi:hypothetical protein